MARLSLLLGLVAPASCIVSEPAEYGAAKQTPPFLDAKNASPSVFHTRPLALGETFTVNVPLRSEDTGEELLAQLFLDRGQVEKKQLLQFSDVPPGKLEDTRSIEISAPIQQAGCHSVSLIVTHKSNLDKNNEPILSSDTAILTWFINVDDDGTRPMSECPVGGN